ncbi:gliding motility-associated C-terminal domain-containing protein [Ekhidna sp.]|uniref:T9SS type B sorting domain-containing protein n=1 Tax=Ekhidna sp. TaxID=2608089 RepID=UPI003BAA1BFD
MTVSISTNTMNNYRNSILTFLLFFSTLILQAQTEDCSNGTDDDGDGLIDCYDGDCSTDGACDDFFFGNEVICADDIDVTTFAIREQWGSADETATSHVTPAIGDLDGNGIPEVISVNNYGTLDLFVLNGATGATIASADIGFTPENAPIVAEIDGDEIGDIIVSQNKGDDLALYNVDFVTGTLTQRWRERASVNQSIGLPGVADFDEDGDVEIYYRNEVMDALTGNVIIAGDGNWEEDYLHGTIAVDLFPDTFCADCNGLELVSGNEVWSINEAAGTRTLIADMDDDIHSDIDPLLNYYPKYYPNWDDQWSTVSAADYNLDGNIDLIMTGALGTVAEKYNGETTIFYWDVTNGNVITYHDPTNDFVRGPGRVNIGDVDGDGQLNANFVMDQKLYSLDENFNIHWIHPIKEGSSGFTGCSLFDFDGDGAVEVVYRSEESLLIVDGVGNGDNTTSERREIACVSRTQEEYPVIADVDGDGSSEICVSCYFNNSTPFSPYSNTRFSQIRVYESDGEAWMPARGVWNQHGYYNVNINDDLTIPTEVQDHSVVFSSGTCEYADGTLVPFPSRPLNTFLNQAPILNEEGCVEFASPDIDFVGILSATDAACPDAEITVAFEITNIGDVDISGNLPVSYYAGDPRTSDGVLLDTEVTLLVGFDVGETLTITQTISGVGGDFELFVVINDNGGTPPLSVPLPTATIPECETGNNIQSTLVGYQAFDLTVEKIDDNRKCDPSKPDNGSARAYYFGPTPGNNETFWIENFEDRAAAAKSDTDETAWTSDGGSQTPDFYGVTSYNGSNMFGTTKTGGANDAGIVTWTSEDIDVSNYTDLNISLDIFENGNQESSGQWRDFVNAYYELRDENNVVTESGLLNNGSQFGDFTYEPAFLSNLNSDGVDSILVIRVEIHSTSSSEHHYIDNISVNGTGPNITREFTEPDGFVFRWYNDDDYSSIVYEGSQYPQMATGTYDVVGYYATTECYSDTVELTINLINTPTFNVEVYEISALTECSTPDGSLGAFAYTTVDGGGIPQDTLTTGDGYAFTWFIQSEGVTPIGTGNILSNLDAIGYTVEVTEDVTGCTVSESRTVSTTVSNPPDPTVAITDISTCGGTGELSADVGGNTADYTFEWYDGPSIKPSSDFTGITYTVPDPGQYTVTATLNSSGCTSDPVTVTVNDNSTAPNPGTTLVQDNTSCVAGNGIVRADGDGAGTVSGYTFEWFLGANTLAANALPGTAAPGAFLVNDNTYELGGLEEATYTVRVTDNSTSCFETRTIDVTDTPGSLSVTPGNLIQNNINSCDAAVLGSIDASDVVPGDVNNVSIGNVNSDFEQPDISGPPYNTNNFTFLDQDEVPGWSTTAGDGVMELWNDGFQGVPAYSGDQFAEILANQIGALYFDLSTVPNSLFSWTFAHRGRGGTDNIRVSIGAVGSEVGQGDFATDNTAWAVYSGNYTVPADQFVTRFQFESLDAGSVGNFVDSVTFVLFPYRFELYEGTSASGTADYINTSGVFNDLDDGNYVLVVYDNLTGCGAVEIPFEITRAQDQPIIATTITDDANCDTDAGSVDVTASMPGSEPASYTYEIFDGHSFTTQIGSDETIADGSVPFTFSNLSPGNYRVRVTNDDTQCTNFEDIVVNDVTVTPTFTATQTINDNTSCDAANPNGFLSVSIQGDAVSNYNFTWYDGASSADPILAGPAVGDNDLDGLDAGDYTVVAENISTGCETVELTLNVGNDPFTPTVVLVEDNADTSCDIGNGQLSAYATSDPDETCTTCVTNYTFEWFYNGNPINAGDNLGNNSNVSFSGTNNSTISGLSADLNNYSVTLTHNRLQCDDSETILLTENEITPTLSLVSTQDNTSCDASLYTGEIHVSVTPAGTYDFDYFYSNGTQVTETAPVSGSATADVTGLINDTYKVVATSTLSCSSDTLEVTVGVNLPVVAVTESNNIDNTVCVQDGVGGNPDANGQVTLTPATSNPAVEPGGGYNFALETAGGTAIDNAGATAGYEDVAYPANNATATITGLPAGNYIMTVTNADNSCPVDYPFTISNGSDDPVVDQVALTASATDNTACVAPFNGTANATVTGGSGTYSYAWATAADPGTTIDTDATLSNVQADDYILIVTDDITGCTSATANVTIGESLPTVAVTESNNIDNTVCVQDGVGGNPDANGQVTLTPATSNPAVEPGGGYNFALETAGGTAIDNAGATAGYEDVAYPANNATATVTGLPAGNYIMTVTNANNNCPVDYPFTISNGSDDPVVDQVALTASATDNTACVAPFTGTANATVTGGSGTYSYAWATAADPGTTIDTDATLSNVQADDYILIVTDDITGCTSATANVTIGESLPTVAVTESNNIDNTVCVQDGVGGNPDANGQVTLTPATSNPAVEPGGGYNFALETAGGTAIDNAGATAGYEDVAYPANNATATITGLPAGNYIMTVTNADNNCPVDYPFTISNGSDDPVVDQVALTASATDNTVCGAPFTGTANATVTGGSGTYSYAWATAADPGTTIDTDATLSNVQADDYILIVTDDITGCTSATANVTIGESLPTVAVTESNNIDNTVCVQDGVGGNPDANGQVTLTPATSNPAVEPGGGYNFALETAGGTAIDNAGATAGYEDVAYPANNATATVTGLPAGNYIMTVTNADNSCPVDYPFTISNGSDDPVVDQVALTASATDNTACVAPFNGTANATVTGGSGTYSYAWATAADPGTTIDTDATLSNVQADDYILIVTDDITGCTSATANVTIGESLPTVAVTESNNIDNTVCVQDGVGGNPDANGQVTLTPATSNPAVEPGGGYNFALETAGGTAIDNAGATAGYEDVAYPANNATATITGLPAGNYIMTVTNADNNCPVDYPFTISNGSDDPVVDQVALTASATDNTACVAPFTGTANATVTGGSGTYSYAWATAADPGTTIDTDATLSNVQADDYILIVTDDITGCTSATANVTIGESLPTVAVTESNNIDNTVCVQDGVGGNPDANGQVTLTPATSNPAVEPGGGYNFALETAGGTAIDNAGATAGYEDVAYPANNATATVTGLPAGNYIMTVTNADNSCPVDYPFTISNGSDDPVVDQVALTASATDNTVCGAPFTGTANATVTGGSGTYSYAWATAADPGTTIDTDATLSNVQADDYILIVTDDITGCTSATANVTIGESLPVIDIITTMDQSDFGCPGTNTGQLTASINGGSTGYTLTWYSGTSATGTAINATTDADNTISGLGAGNYIVEVQNNTTFCTETEVIAVTAQTLTLTPNTGSTDQMNCNIEDGTATVTSVTVAGAPVGHTPVYKYDWYLGATQLVEIPFNGLTGTFEESETINIGGETATVIAFDASGTILASNLSGDISNGNGITGASSGAAATVNSGENITTTGTVGVSTLNYLTAGTYSVFVSDTQSGCTSSRTDIVVGSSLPASPTITITADAIPGACNGQGGELSAIVTDNGGGIANFYWYEGSDDFANNDPTGADALADGTSQLQADPTANIDVNHTSGTTTELDNIVSGLYTLVVEDNSGCRYQSTFDLPFNGIQTTTALTVTNVDECPDNGTAAVSLADFQSLTVTYDGGNTGDFETLEPYTSVDNGGGSNATGFISFDDGAGTVQLSILSGSLASGFGDEIVGTNTGNRATIDAISGAGFVNNEADDIDEYIIYLYAGSGVPADRFTAYTITNSTGASLRFPYSYDPDDGRVFDGDGIQIDNPGTISEGGTITFNNLPSGPYTAIAREKASAAFASGDECWTTAAIDNLVQEAYDPIITSFDVVDDSFCDSDNGSLSVTVTENADDDFLGSGFTFEWYVDGAGVPFFTETISDNTNPFASGYTVTSTTPSNLAADDYYVDVTRHNSTTVADIGCSVTSATFTIAEDLEIQEILTVDITANDDCDPFNGEVEVTAINDNGTSSTTFTDYLFKWYLSDQATQIIYIPYNTLAGGTFENGDNLSFAGGGTATVISDNNADALIATYTAGTIANGENFNNGGGVTATTVLTNSIDNTGSIADNHFRVFESGTYYITIDDLSGSGCPTVLNFYEVIVEDERINPAISVTANADDISCDDDATNPPTGQATAAVNNGSMDVDDYIFTWYFDAGATNTLDPTDDPGLVNLSFDGTGASGNTTNGQAGVNRINNLPAGTYYIVAEDLTNPGDGCTSPIQSVTIDQFESTILVGNTLNTDYTISANEDCTPSNGAFEVLRVTETRPSGLVTNTTMADYTFDWFESDGTTALADALVVGANNGDAGASEVAGLTAGTYYVQITNTAETGCTQTAAEFVEFVIEDERINPAISVTANADDISCDDDATNPPTGQATAAVNNGSMDVDDYIFTWYFDAGATNTLDPTDDPGLVNLSFDGTGASGNTTNGQAGVNRINNLPAGTYYIVAEDLTNPGDGCTSPIQSVTIDQFESTILVGNTLNTDYTISANEDCTPSNGAFEVLRVTETRPSGLVTNTTMADYTFDWFESDGTTALADALVVGANNGDAGASEVAGLTAGTYYVQITNTAETGCTQTAAEFVEFVIEDERINPAISVTANADDISCDDDATNPPTGQATAAVNNGSMDVDDYIFTWYFDAGATNTLDPTDDPGLVNLSFDGTGASGNTTNGQAGVNRINNLPAGTYYIVAEDLTNPGDGCTSPIQSVTIDQFESTILVGNTLNTDYTISANEDCTPSNGAFEVLRVTETRPSGLVTNTTMADYTFDWFESDGTTALADALVVGANNGDAGASEVAGLTAGTYYVQITNTAETGCTQTAAEFVEFVIEDERINPAISVTANADDISCDDDATNPPTGQATAAVNNGSMDVDDYIFTWYFDAGATNTLDPTDDPGLVNLSFDGTGASGNTTNGQAGVNRINNLPAGTYYIVAEDLTNPGDGCTSPIQSVTIDQFESTILVGNTLNTDYTISANEDCTPSNGAFEVLRVTETRPSGLVTNTTMADYTFDWFESDGTTALADALVVGANNGDAGASEVAGLTAGTYYVQITNTAETGCTQTAAEFVEFVIEDERINPAISVTANADDISCDDDATNPPTGQATAAVNNGSMDVDDYIFTWYFDAGATNTLDPTDDPGLVNLSFDGTGASGNTTNGQAGVNRINNLPAGTYYIVAEDLTNPGDGCTSPIQSVTIDQFESTILVGNTLNTDYTISANEDCTPSNGAFEVLRVTETRPSGLVTNTTMADYTFDWFESDGTTALADALVVGANNGDAGASEVAGLTAGTYYVQITNTAETGCTQTAAEFVEFVIEDERINPAISVTANADDISCDDDATNPPTGQATAAVNNGSMDVDDYIFTWYFDAGATNTLDPTDDPGLVNLSFDGTGASGNTTNGQAGVNRINNLPAGTYYIVAEDLTNPGDGCTSPIQSVTIDQFESTILVGNTLNTDYTISANEDCTPSNGAFEVLRVTETRPSGLVTNTTMADYTFDWFESDGTTALADALVVGANNGDAGASEVAGLTAGTYYVQITNTAETGCTQTAAEFVEFVIEDERINPAISVTANADDISCDDDATNPPTGQATAAVNNGSMDVDDYIFTWYFDAGATNTLDPTDDPGLVNLSFDGTGASGNTTNGQAGVNRINNLPAGTYYIVAEDLTNPGDGCTSPIQSVTIDQFESTILVGNTLNTDYTISANEDCTPSNGAFEVLRVTETRPSGLVTNTTMADYTFDWFESDGTTALADALVVGANNGDAGASEVAGLTAGTYYVQITNTAETGCTQTAAEFVEFVIEDERINPAISVTANADDISCDDDATNPPTGQATAAVNNGSMDVDDYIFTWYFDAGATNTLDPTDDPGLVNLSFDGTGASGNTTNGQAGVNRINNLPAGTYYIVAEDLTNPGDGCTSPIQSVTIDQFESTILVGNTLNTDYTISANEDCTPSNGAFEVLRVTETRPSGLVTNTTMADYTFDWFESDGTTALADALVVGANNGDAGASEVAGLTAGTYYVQITNTAETGCTQTAAEFVEFVIEDERINPAISVTANADDISCDDDATNPPTGQATAAVNNGSMDVDDYIFTWYFDAGATNTLDPTDDPGLVNLSFDGTGASGNTTNGQAGVNRINNLPAGTYYIVAEDLTNPGDGCTSPIQSVTIDQFESTILVGNTLNTDYTISANEDCTPSNGAFEVLRVTETRPSGLVTNTTMADYTFDWFESDGTTALADALVVGANNGDAGASEVAGLTAGTYYVQITNTAETGCTQTAAEFVEFVIEDERINPAISVTANADDISCDDDATNPPTGQATAAVNNGSMDVDDYIFTWYFDAGATNTLDPTDDPGLVNLSFDGTGASGNTTNGQAGVNRINNLPAGTYYIVAEDLTNPGDGCTSPIQSVTIDQFESTILVGNTLNTDYTISANEDCTPSNGAFEVLRVTETRPSGLVTNTTMADYTFDWFESDGTTALADALVVGANNGDAGASEVAGLTAGTYYVQITNTAETGCTQTAAEFVEFVIEDERINPAISVTANADDISCDDDATNPPTGQATAAVNNGSMDVDDYIFTWYFDAGATNTLDPTDDPGLVNLSFDGTGASGNTTNGQAGVNRINNLPAGTYYIVAEDLTNPGDGCTSPIQSVTIDQFESTILVGNTLNTDYTISANEDCTPSNGAFEVLRVTETRPSGLVTNTTMADYTFDWFESDGTTALADALVVGANNGDAGASEVAGLTAGTYYVQITNTAETGCTQTAAEFVEFVIEDERVNPIISLSSKSDDTYCDNAGNQGDGALTIAITDETIAGTPSDYTITWYRGAIAAANEIFPNDGGSRGTATASGDLTAISNLATGDYTVQIVKDLGDTPNTGNTGCTASAAFTVDSQDNIPTLDVSAIQARVEADSLCTGNSGTLIINDSDVSSGDLSDFEIRIYTGAVGSGELAGSPYTNIVATSISYTTLASNDYFITAENTTTGCMTATGMISIEDSVRNPQVTLVSMTPDEDCGGGVNAGGLEVLIDGQFDHTDHFTVQWVNDATGNNVSTDFAGVTDNEVALQGVPSGNYTVTVTNTNTSCSISRSYAVTNVQELPSIFNYTVTNNDICDDDNDGNPLDVGSFELVETNFKGTIINQASMAGNYRLEVYDDAALTVATTDGDGDPNNFIYTELSAGSYFAVVRKLDSDCVSESTEFDIVDNVLRPAVRIVLQVADSTCAAGATPNGSLRATATVGTTSNIDDTDPDYTFQWYLGSGTTTPLVNNTDPGNGSNPVGVSTSDISGLAADTYTVEVTRLSTGCVTLEEFALPNVPTNVQIFTAATTDATICSPGNGTITVTSVNRDNVSDYNFDYYDVDPTTGSPAPVFTGNAGAAYVTATPRTYWIIGTNTIVNCTTPVFEIEVGENISYPVITLDDFDFQTNCSPSNPNGGFVVLADGQPENATYDFEWYFGTGTTNPLTSDDYTGGSNLTGANTNNVSGLAAGFYTVEVTDNTTGCTISETYEMVDNIPNPIPISTTTSANTNCVNPNGKVAASVITPAPGRSVTDYAFYWFIGNITTVGTNPNPANADYTGSLVENLPSGNYVVLVVDLVDNLCVSNATQVFVEPATTDPVYELTSSDVTVCFDVKNGFASVSVPNLSSVDIAWYDDSNIEIGTGFFIDSLRAGTYSVVLTNVITGCPAGESFDILNVAEIPNAPTVIVNNGRNNCSFANGSAIANVDGVTNNFIFEWFDPTDMTTPYTTGSEVFNLDTTTYLVRARNLSTGCESSLTSVEVRYEVVDPVYEVIFNNSVCLRTEDGSTNQFSGSAKVGFEQFNLATDYEWRDANGTIVGNESSLIDAYPGDYTVTFTAENGCTYDASFTIETSLTIYNGVSANADGKNDFFLIDCIDYFPNNNVKIFNRAGQKIFDIDGYNNTSVRFEGFSNVGGGGLKLPAGTYFYLVDLGTGEDPVQGYLELVR